MIYTVGTMHQLSDSNGPRLRRVTPSKAFGMSEKTAVTNLSALAAFPIVWMHSAMQAAQ